MITEEHIGRIVRLTENKGWYFFPNGIQPDNHSNEEFYQNYEPGTLFKIAKREMHDDNFRNDRFWAIPLSNPEQWIYLFISSHGIYFEPLS